MKIYSNTDKLVVHIAACINMYTTHTPLFNNINIALGRNEFYFKKTQNKPKSNKKKVTHLISEYKCFNQV